MGCGCGGVANLEDTDIDRDNFGRITRVIEIYVCEKCSEPFTSIKNKLTEKERIEYGDLTDEEMEVKTEAEQKKKVTLFKDIRSVWGIPFRTKEKYYHGAELYYIINRDDSSDKENCTALLSSMSCGRMYFKDIEVKDDDEVFMLDLYDNKEFNCDDEGG